MIICAYEIIVVSLKWAFCSGLTLQPVSPGGLFCSDITDDMSLCFLVTNTATLMGIKSPRRQLLLESINISQINHGQVSWFAHIWDLHNLFLCLKYIFFFLFCLGRFILCLRDQWLVLITVTSYFFKNA